MAYDALEIVRNRNDFYRDGFHKLAIALLVSLAMNLLLAFIIYVVISNKPAPTYFATTDSGRITPLIPLDQPNISDKALASWASNAVISLNSYDFVNFRKSFQDNEQYFTRSGWNSYMSALADSKQLKAVQENKYVVSAVLTGAPVVKNRYTLEGRYIWEVQMPIMVTFQNSSGESKQDLMAQLTIQRVSTLDNVNGVGISSLVMQSR